MFHEETRGENRQMNEIPSHDVQNRVNQPGMIHVGFCASLTVRQRLWRRLGCGDRTSDLIRPIPALRNAIAARLLREALAAAAGQLKLCACPLRRHRRSRHGVCGPTSTHTYRGRNRQRLADIDDATDRLCRTCDMAVRLWERKTLKERTRTETMQRKDEHTSQRFKRTLSKKLNIK